MNNTKVNNTKVNNTKVNNTKVNNSAIIGVGKFLPDKVLTNADLEKIVETTDEWIVARTGISQRHIVDEGMTGAEMASKAALQAIKNAGIDVSEIDLIIYATITQDMCTPSNSCTVQTLIGAPKAIAFDINAACTGFIYGITIANQFITSGYCKCALVIGADALSRITDYTDRNTCVLFGDGAGAVILKESVEGFGIVETDLGADGELGSVLTCPNTYISELEKSKRTETKYRTVRMDGSKVFPFAVKVMVNSTKKVLEKAGVLISDVDMIIPHQANIRIIDSAAKRLGFPIEKIFSNLKSVGNTSAASIPLAMAEAWEAGRLIKGNFVVLVGFGGGLTWGAALLKWAF